MTRKDYKAVADALRSLAITQAVATGCPQERNTELWVRVSDVVSCLGKVFAEDNPRFSYERFHEAVWNYKCQEKGK